MAYGLGVDLGTTYSSAAVSTSGRVEISALGTRAAVIPSVLLVRDDGEVLVGEAAERRSVTEPSRTARAFKRRFGDTTPLFLGGAPYGAEALTAMLLRAIVGQVAEAQGGPPERLAVTHPATYGPYKVDLLRLAVQQAGLGEALLVPEPVAAAVHYTDAERIEPGDVVAVYDFGGGTFDAAVLRRTPESFDVIGQPEGLDRLGGIDIDEAVLNHVDESLGGLLRELDPADPAVVPALARLRFECQAAKEALSHDTDTSISVVVPTLTTEVRLTRAELEAVVRPRLADTVDVLYRCIRSAGLRIEDVSRVLLVGGSSRMPLVRQVVREATDRPVAVDAHPKHSVALGAAALVAPILGAASNATAGPPIIPTAAAPPAQGAAPAPATASIVPPSIAPPPVAATPPAETPPAAVPPAAVAPPRRSGRWVLVVLGLLAAIVVAVLVLAGGDSDPDSGDASTATLADPPATTATPAGPPATEPPDGTGASTLDLPRAGRYADLEITAASLTLEGGDGTTPDRAILSASVRNTLEMGTVYLAFSTVELVIDGAAIDGVVEDGPGFAEGGATVPSVWSFDLSAVADPEGAIGRAVLRVSDPGDTPLELPLSGEVTPVEIGTVSVPATTSYAQGQNQLTWRFDSIDVGLDAGYDQPGTSEAAARRAANGSMFVHVRGELTASCPAGCAGGLLAVSSQTALVVDGSVTPPWVLSFDEVLVDGQTLDAEVVFEVPMGAASYVLRLGDGGATTDVPLTITTP